MIEADLTRIINEVGCEPYELAHGPLMGTGLWFVQAKVWHVNPETGDYQQVSGRQIIINPNMTEDTIIRQCFNAYRGLAEDQVTAAFTWRGKRVLSGKVSLEKIWRTL